MGDATPPPSQSHSPASNTWALEYLRTAAAGDHSPPEVWLADLAHTAPSDADQAPAPFVPEPPPLEPATPELAAIAHAANRAASLPPAPPATRPTTELQDARAAAARVLPWASAVCVWAVVLGLAMATTLWVMRTTHTPASSTPRTSMWADTPAALSDQAAADRSEVLPDVTNPSSQTPPPVPRGGAMDVAAPLMPTIQGMGLAAAGASASSPLDAPPDTADLQVELFGLPATARRIVFVVDASGSLLDTLPYVLRELQSRIGDLSRKQRFTILFFTGQPGADARSRLVEIQPGGLGKDAIATQRRKLAAVRWIDPEQRSVEPAFRGDPIAAIAQALTYEPDVIYLLSDNITGVGQRPIDQQRFLREVRRANPGNTQIHTIQFVYEDPLAQILDPRTGKPRFQRTLRLLAEQNAGKHIYIKEEDLLIQSSNRPRRRSAAVPEP